MRSRRNPLAVEQLEDRQLPSLVIAPAAINLKTAARGHASFTVELISDDGFARDMLRSASTLTTTITPRGGAALALTPASARLVDVNGDGMPDLVQRFRRRGLKGLPPGNATITVTLNNSSETEFESHALLLTGGSRGTPRMSMRGGGR